MHICKTLSRHIISFTSAILGFIIYFFIKITEEFICNDSKIYSGNTVGRSNTWITGSFACETYFFCIVLSCVDRGFAIKLFPEWGVLPITLLSQCVRINLCHNMYI